MTRARDVADKNLAVISAGNSGQILTSDGNNWSAQNSPVELPAHGTNGNVLTSDGDQWTSAAPVPTDLVNDTSPQLGGDLDMQSHSISNGVLGVKNTGTQSELRLYCESGNAHYVGLKAPAHSAFSGNHSITMPPNTGNSGEFLKTDGSGVTSWAAAGGGAWELLQTIKIPSSNTSTSLIQFTNKFTTDYDVYQFVGTSMQPSSGGQYYLYSRLLNSSGTGVSSNYAFVNDYTNSNSGGNGYRSHTSNSYVYMPLTFEGQTGGANGYSQSFVYTVFDPLRNVDGNFVNFQSEGVTTASSGFGVFTSNIRGLWYGDTSTQFYGLEFFYSGGSNLTGQISLYGQKK